MKKKCVICEGIMGKEFTKQSKHPDRCKDCEFVEERITGVCFLCGFDAQDTVSYYKQFGNMCSKCNQELVQSMKMKKKHSLPIPRK